MTGKGMLYTKFNGDKEAFSKFMSEIGKKGGSAKVPKGTAMYSKEKLFSVSSKGGRVRHGKTV